jgi:phage recombination protein Bet
MSNIAAFHPAAGRSFEFEKSALALIRRTVAADTTDDEFNLFISYCKALRLDPRRRQIYALVYSKQNPKKRRMSIIVAIDGFRAIAARSGCYRPDEEEPRYEFDAALIGKTNPTGLVKVSVKVWQFSHGQWHATTAVAYWDEYCPLRDEWIEDDTGKRCRSGRKVVEGKWAAMPRLMLAKVAEALALRRAWPDDFSGVYSEEEVERSTVEDDLLPAEAAAAGAAEERLQRTGSKDTILIDWMDDRGLLPVPIGRFVDTTMEYVQLHKREPSVVLLWQQRNRHGLREFWSRSPNDALAIKKEIEAIVSELPQANP